MEEDGWSEAQVNIEDEEVRTSEAQVRTSQAQACITQNTQAVQTPPSQLVFSVIDQEAEPSTLPRPVPQHNSTADPSTSHIQDVQTPPSQHASSVIDQEAEPSTLPRPVPQHSSTVDPSTSHQASPSCNPPLPGSQDQQSAAAPAEVAEAAKPPVFNSSPSIATNSKSENNPLSQLVDAIRFMLDPKVKERAVEIGEAMDVEDGVTGAENVFHRHFPHNISEDKPESLPARRGLFFIRRCFGYSSYT
ncbi:PREDICTED: sterol [Prunus dulcis]|uniref:PREDICTED: sterol n=1 Tax=Prunus dulcis TaxID=3755 RepID=A0A5E4EWW7_PRUDU|nr:mucin-2-like [Prunus dulcis]XP_034198955.1 mucin-2-like [Prunus dulcis]VVA20277.1 PREDICTED: sterol [Prunus dulcis]